MLTLELSESELRLVKLPQFKLAKMRAEKVVIPVKTQI
jgi:hypothetical protein